MDLENQVPELELCRDIPDGCFEDSALVWLEVEIPQENKKEWRVVNTTKPILACHNPKHPAPTLQEIMVEIEKRREFPTAYWNGEVWTVECEPEYCLEPHSFEDKESPANAALKLWLEVTKGEREE